MTNYKYEVDENNVVRIWSLRKPLPENAPLIKQPTWPNGEFWESKDQAASWAEAFIECREDEDGAYRVGNGPDEGLKVIVPPKEPVDETTEETTEEATTA